MGWVGIFLMVALVAMIPLAVFTPALPPVAVWLVIGVIALVCLAFSSQTIEVTDEAVISRFGPGILVKRAPLSDIVKVENMPSHWYDGWGVHLTTRGWLYNVSGFGAVEFTLRDGGRFRFGTDRPDQLIDAVEQSIRVPDKKS
jgi:hypothetical protein